jgi:hypothetical protein
VILYDDKTLRKEELLVGDRIAGKRFTEITLTHEDVKLLVRYPAYLYTLLVGFRPKEPS